MYVRLPENVYRCCYLNCVEKENLAVIPKKRRYEVLQHFKLFIPKLSRMCPVHQVIENWDECIESSKTEFTPKQSQELLDLLIKKPKENKKIFVTATQKDTSLTNDQFLNLFQSLTSLRANIKNENKSKLALKMYLNRLRTGDTLIRNRTNFGMGQKKQATQLKIVREALLADFVPHHLGFDSFDRNSLINNSSQMVRNIFGGNKVVIVADGTYIYVNKSGNFDMQRKTYNDQKKRNFVKPMVFTATNGKIIEIFGIFEAIINDAKIMKLIMNDESMRNKLKENDMFILDRGFRDCVKDLEREGFIVKMPALVQKSEARNGQLTTQQGNESRLVTACRFVVESRNGHLKSIFKIFSRTWSTKEIPHLMNDIRIAAALINAYRMTIESNKEDATEIAREMKERVSLKNKFATIVNSKRFQSLVKHSKLIDPNLVEFPIISLERMKKISLGSYQLKMTRSYLAEHMRKSNNELELYEYPIEKIQQTFDFFIEKGNKVNLKIYFTKMYSRFQSKKYHMVYIMCDLSKNGVNAISGYSCDCKHGLRMVGSCCHTIALISYLSHYRFKGDITEIAANINQSCFPDRK